MADDGRMNATPPFERSRLVAEGGRRVQPSAAWHRSCTTPGVSRASAETEDVMRVLVFVATVAIVGIATPLLVQERPISDSRGFLTGLGGTTRALGNSSSDLQLEGGVRIAPHLMIFGNIG